MELMNGGKSKVGALKLFKNTHGHVQQHSDKTWREKSCGVQQRFKEKAAEPRERHVGA